MGTDIHAVFQSKKMSGWVDVDTTWDQRRHYFLFAWLAGVRNGFGFAGVRMHEPITPISEPRGLPKDFDRDDEDYMGEHNFSWLTAEEILAAPRPGVTRRYGVLDRDVYEAWDKKSCPSSYSGDVSGRDVVKHTPENITPETTHVQCEWVEDDSELDYFVQEVRRLRDEHSEVRLVFGFDS